MPRILLQPAGGTEAAKHFRNTILSTVPLRRCAEFITSVDVADLAAVYGKDGVRAWGVTPGMAYRNERKWKRIEHGDAALFCGNGEVFAFSFVTHKLHNRELAIDLWGQDNKGQTWEYMYFVTPPMTASISYGRLAAVLDYSPEFVVLGFMVLDEQQSARVLTEFGLVDD